MYLLDGEWNIKSTWEVFKMGRKLWNEFEKCQVECIDKEMKIMNNNQREPTSQFIS